MYKIKLSPLTYNKDIFKTHGIIGYPWKKKTQLVDNNDYLWGDNPAIWKQK